MMFDVLKNIKNEYVNANILENTNMTPESFVMDVLSPIILQTNTPQKITNKEKKHKQSITYSFCFEILRTYKYYQLGFNSVYEFETPYNKMLLWGIMFESLYQIFINNVLIEPVYQVLKITHDTYNKLPKHYHDIFIKTNNNEYEIKVADIDFCINYKNRSEIDNLVTRIKPLMTRLYKKEIVDFWKQPFETFYDYWERNNIWSLQYGRMANKNPLKSYFISDKQLAAIKELQDIFHKIASYCFIFENKHNVKNLLREIQNNQILR